MKKYSLITTCLLFSLGTAVPMAEDVDLSMMTRIRQEGLENSQVMDILSDLTDVNGPRLTGSPGLMRASRWARDKMAEWGLSNASLEPWGEFGRGWSLKRFSLEMTEPYYMPLIGYPEAWTSGTDGVASGTPVLLRANSKEELENFRGKVKGALIMLASEREAETHWDPDARRHTEEDLAGIARAPEPGRRSPIAGRRAELRQRRAFQREVREFLKAEGARVVLQSSRGEHGTLFVVGAGSRNPEEEPALPTITVSVEAFQTLSRLLDKGIHPEISVLSEVELHSEDLQGYNVIAEIPGTDPRLQDELVMLGGHIDSWHAGTGAADNAAGVAVSMEAVRILRALDLHPRRTIRVAFWSGEEQGLLGSRNYVERHFGDRKTMQLLPEHEKLSVYFNFDNGTGKIRGVYLQGNDAVRPIFEEWLRPFADLGATTLTIRNTGGTDHLSFDAVGLPGFQFIQDPIDYSSRTHHTNMDVWDHALAGDLMQASVIMAAFVHNAAMRDEKLPRKPLPQPEPDRTATPSLP